MNIPHDPSRRRGWLTTACALVLLLGVARPGARAYNLSGDQWPDGQPIVMSLGLGSPNKTLIDGSTTWDQVAESALTVWNYYLKSDMQFEGGPMTSPPGHNNGRSEVFFSDSVYGEGFGDDTLAVTIPKADSYVTTEADVIVNTAVTFDSYRNDQSPGNGSIYDLRRVLIHEFGHVLGLEHVAQNTLSIMTPTIGDIETVQYDDAKGIVAMYGDPARPPVIHSDTTASGVVGQEFFYAIEAYALPKQFLASGLPGGLSLDTADGAISGRPTIPGVYTVLLTASNSYGTDTATLVLSIAGKPVVTSPTTATAFVGQPFVYRITANNGPTGYLANDLPTGLSVDANTGLITGVPTLVGIYSAEIIAANRAGEGGASLHFDIRFDQGIVTLHSFKPADGDDSFAPVMQAADGSIYGTTASDGKGTGGAVFKVAPDATFTQVFAFDGASGAVPFAGLLQAADGNLYGTTSKGGQYNGGTIFKITPDGTLTTIHEFQSGTGCNPRSELIQASDGNLYGTTSTKSDTAPGGGTIFKLTPDAVLTTVYTFKNGEGSVPSKLVQTGDGNLYGTTQAYPPTIFRVGTDGKFTTLYRFDPTKGTALTALTPAGDGSLYGVLQIVDDHHGSEVFRWNPADNTINVIHVFTMQEGVYASALCLGKDGNFYGTTRNVAGKPLSYGTLFKITPDGAVTTLHTFVGSEGNPNVGLIQGTDGEFYGTTGETGVSTPYSGTTFGIVFRTTLNDPPVTPPTVTVEATTPHVTVGSGNVGAFTLTLSAPQTHAVMVYYAVKGTAINGGDYVFLTGKKKIKTGKTSKPINVVPLGDLGGEAKKAVKIVLQPDPNYTVGARLPSKVKIFGPQ